MCEEALTQKEIDGVVELNKEWIPLNEKMLMCVDCKSRFSELSDAVCPVCGGSGVEIELAFRVIPKKEKRI